MNEAPAATTVEKLRIAEAKRRQLQTEVASLSERIHALADEREALRATLTELNIRIRALSQKAFDERQERRDQPRGKTVVRWP